MACLLRVAVTCNHFPFWSSRTWLATREVRVCGTIRLKKDVISLESIVDRKPREKHGNQIRMYFVITYRRRYYRSPSSRLLDGHLLNVRSCRRHGVQSLFASSGSLLCRHPTHFLDGGLHLLEELHFILRILT